MGEAPPPSVPALREGAGGIMQKLHTKAGWRLAGAAAALVLLWSFRSLIWLAARQAFLGALTALAALPVMRRMEKRLSPGLSAALAVATLYMALAAALFLLVPAMLRQGRQLAAALPVLWRNLAGMFVSAGEWLDGHGFSLADEGAYAALLVRGQEALGAAVPALVEALGGFAGNVGQWLLAPLLGFYFLKDRRMISRWALLQLPAAWREPAVRGLREMKRETAGYLRGQLMVSAIVGALTAAGLLACGVPAWLMLGAAIGLLELIPYAGPVAGAALAVLFALPQGLWRALWALGVVVAVQQLDGSLLSPRLISQTTRLHPAAVMLCVVAGAAAGGVAGILLAVPLVLCARAAVRVALVYLPSRG